MSEADERERLAFFETHIRPVLHTRCVKCHGENKQEGELRLDSMEGLLEGGESGSAIVPGKPNESLLLEAVRYESLEMPPDKPLTETQIENLTTWIANGAVWTKQNGRSVRLEGTAFTEEEKSFWSLQPITHPDPPTGDLNPIDAFVFAKLKNAGLTPSPRAPSQVLLRRLWFDVLGVPPSPNELDQTGGRIDGDEWSKLVERLLADPRYGEHWARYWLDVVRYAESDGFRADFYRPDAWRYRDYVVDAFNEDKPYDRFVAEQLAGDEIAPDSAAALVATGFLRTYLYEYNQRDARTQWQDILNQVTDVTGEVFLGMGVGCARCHDHKFDPILQADYFRLQACFGTMMPRDDIPAADLADRQRYEKEHDAWRAKAAELREELAKLREPWHAKAAKGATVRFPQDIQEIMAKEPHDRNPLEAQLADLVNRQIDFDLERQKIADADLKRIEQLEKQIKEAVGKEPAALPAAITVADVGATPQTIHIAANPKRKTVGAGGFTILNPQEFDLKPKANSTGQRSALAKWITSPQNPLTARVIVNRIWQQHFGAGLVTTASDFGSLGGRPSHPKLLDWLASEFMAHGWSIKWLHRQILNSATWQMSAFHSQAAQAEKIDPANRLRWRFDIRRLSAEQIRDAMLTTSGELKSEQGGPSVDYNSLRRSLYLKAMRNTPEPLMRSLDGVDGLNSTPKRSTTTTPTQALNLMNGEWTGQRSVAMATRVLEQFEDYDPDALIDGAFLTALGRHAVKSEISEGVRFLAEAGGFEPARADDLRSPILSSGGAAIRIGTNGFTPLKTKGNDPALAAPFSFAGIIRLDSLYKDASVRTIISQWKSSQAPGWSIGVTSEKSRYQPRNFILQVVSDRGYEVVASNLRPEPGQAYLAAVTIHRSQVANGTAPEGASENAKATFYLQKIGTRLPEQPTGEPIQTAEVLFKSAAGITGKVPVVVGGRMNGTKVDSNHRWDGQLDQVSLFDSSLTVETIKELFAAKLASNAISSTAPAAFWSFDDAADPTKDFSLTPHALTADSPKLHDPRLKAMAAFCHVLMNSNEFVYID